MFTPPLGTLFSLQAEYCEIVWIEKSLKLAMLKPNHAKETTKDIQPWAADEHF